MAWFVAKEGKRFCIRNTEGKRYPRKDYPRDASRESLEMFVTRINGRENRRAIEAIKIKLAFVPVEILEEFRVLLKIEIPNQKDARYHYKNLHRYFLAFFVEELRLMDPLQWKEHEHLWGDWLMNGRASHTIKGIIQVANRFMSYLHKKRPKEVPSLRFDPISKAKLKHYGASLKANEKPREAFISEKHWTLIDSKLPDDIAPFVRLAYYYGLRRSETLGLRLDDVRKAHLSVERQVRDQLLKNRQARKTPHWFCSPKLCHELIEQTLDKKIHQDTLGVKFALFMAELKLSYNMHDLRRTFITRALDVATPKEVMMAVGHANIETTMIYMQDDRDLDDAVWRPLLKSS